MTPILGIWASQISGRLWEPAGAYDALATVTVGSTAVSTIEFAGIPTGYKHLQVRIMQMTSGTINPKLRINGDTTGANYYMHSIYNNNPNVSAYNEANNSSGISYLYNETTQPAVAVIDILDYSSTTKNKTIRDLGGYDANGSGYIFYRSGGWFQTSAITRLTFAEPSNFLTGTQFALYGIK
jgi:hypothetical protein